MLARAAREPSTVAWVQGDAAQLPFRDATVEAVVCTESFHWYPDQAAALREIRRVLRPGGTLLVALVNPRVAALAHAASVASRFTGGPFHWPTRAEVRDALERVGLEVRDQRETSRIPGRILFPGVLTIATRPSS
jgi:ubiquinone/menaquinone biosynthesis C-methylase UbiE